MWKSKTPCMTARVIRSLGRVLQIHAAEVVWRQEPQQGQNKHLIHVSCVSLRFLCLPLYCLHEGFTPASVPSALVNETGLLFPLHNVTCRLETHNKPLKKEIWKFICLKTTQTWPCFSLPPRWMHCCRVVILMENTWKWGLPR